MKERRDWTAFYGGGCVGMRGNQQLVITKVFCESSVRPSASACTIAIP